MTNEEYLEKYYDGNIEDALKRLDNGEAIQYIVGNVDFYGYPFKVNKDVLIPRFETEELVNKMINYIRKYFDKKVSILDIGTGSGCIAITLKKELDADITALDISLKALDVASYNAKLNNVDINFIQSDILSNVDGTYDVIISNPPYIAYDEPIMELVSKNEPSMALYAPNNGLYFYQIILSQAKKYLNKKNIIAFEIGYLQGNDISLLAKKYFPNAIITVEKDLALKDRYVFIINK